MKARKFQFFILLLTPLLVSCSLRGRLFATPTLSPTATLTLTSTASPTPTPSLTSTPSPTPTFTPTPLLLYRKILSNVTYCTIDETPQLLDIYMPEDGSSGPWPVIVFLHGGAWGSGDKAALKAKNVAKLLNPLGYVVASLNYRLYPVKFPAMIEDAKCGVRFLRANAVKYNLDPNRFVAWGTSAGAHLAALLGTTDRNTGWDVGEYLDQSSRVQGVVDVSGPADLTIGFKTIGLGRDALFVFGIDREPRILGSPITYATVDDPPFLILNGDKDRLVQLEHGQAMYDALINVGVLAKLVIVKNGDHDLDAAKDVITSPTQDEINQIYIDFLNETLKQKP